MKEALKIISLWPKPLAISLTLNNPGFKDKISNIYLPQLELKLKEPQRQQIDFPTSDIELSVKDRKISTAVAIRQKICLRF